ncbi:hypothetical protein [Perlabentimonas gracilis]|uniref:hypothetical protein n=1 Tax=Perlabentimonas gracilis TaxID=2715279 RepID=UPI00140DB76A|nr:hypothetical protein [Perlabentimonas gracilis]NHB68881.1 hypothetical protein [Perlabentimonas gracilis]
MCRKSLLLILLTTIALAVCGQPMLSHWFSPQPDISNGNPYRSIEETSEVIIPGLNSSPTKVVKKFNEMGNIISSNTYNSAGGLTSEITWDYMYGNLLVHKYQRSFVNLRGWSEEEVTIEWDEETELPTRIEVNKNKEPWQWATLIAGADKRIESAQVFNSKGLVYTERVMYMEPSNLIRVRIHRANNSLAGTASYPINPLKPYSFESVARTYYPNGDIMTETLTHAVKGDQAYFYEYEYDHEGNWIEKRTYQVSLGRGDRIRNKKLENKVTRKITYH